MIFRIAVAATALSLAPMARAEGIAVVAPQSGPYELLGAQIRDGAAAAATAAGQTIFLINESCEAGSAPEIARRIIEAKADAAMGFLCSESLDGALPVLAEASIPAITVSVRWKALMEDALKHGWPFFRLAPAPEHESEKLVEAILANWPGAPWALIEDGTIHGRELAEAVRAGLEERGLKPVFTDTFRPGQEQQVALIRRLKKSGATHVFVGGDRNDVAIIARDATAEASVLTVLGGDAMRAADQPVPLADGVLAVALPEHASGDRAAQAVKTLKDAGVEAEGYVLPSHAAAEILLQARAASSQATRPTAEVLQDTSFDTVIGPIAFGASHELRDNPYRLLEWQGGSFAEPQPAGQ